MNFLQRLTVIWQNISIVQKSLLGVIVLAVILVGGLFTYWAQMPDMKVLYSGLAPDEAARITDKISDKGVAYKLNSSGTSIYVPKQHVSQLRLDMAKDGLPTGGQKGYSIFDDEKVGVSPFVQSVNLKRALQEELAKSIQMIEGVMQVRIHIVTPENNLFVSQRSETTASVVLQLRPGYVLSQQNVAAISHIVTGSVESLKPENVTIVDSQGRLLSSRTDDEMFGGSGTVADYRERVEQNMANKIQDMLTTVLGPGRATVKVSAEVDMTSSNVAREVYDEGKKVTTKEEITTESEIETSGSTEEGQTAPGSTRKNDVTVTEYAVPKTVEQTVELAGEISSISVAVFVDLSPEPSVLDPQNEDGTTAVPETAGPIMEITEIEEIIKRAVGPKLASDGLKVVDVKFNRQSYLPAEEETGGGLDYIQIARQGSLGILAICALIVLKIFSGSKKAVSAEAAMLPGLQPGQSAGLLSAQTGISESMMLRNQIAQSLRNNPDQVKQLFSSWLQEKGSA